MAQTIESTIDEYKGGALSRRTFLTRLITLTGSMAATHWLLESSGLADVVSERESQAIQVTSETVRYATDKGVNVTGHLSVPGATGKFPAVVVIHENRGLNEHTRDVARRFAAAGFVALAPDLLSRKGGTGAMESPDKAREAITSLPAEDTMADLKACLRFLDSHAKVNKGQLGSVGFCWGGARSFLLAAESPVLRAAVVFYGSAPEAEKIAQIRCPVLGLYGETDERITSKVPTVAEQMEKAGKSFTHKIYAGAGHAFFNDTGERYDAAAARDSWTRALKFLRGNLK